MMSDTGYNRRRSRSVKVNGEHLRELRFLRGWTQQDLAAATDLSVRTIESVEAGKPVYHRTVTLLAKALKVPVESLVEGRNDFQAQGFSVRRTDEIRATDSKDQEERSFVVQILVDRDINLMTKADIEGLLGSLNQALQQVGEVRIIKVERG